MAEPRPAEVEVGGTRDVDAVVTAAPGLRWIGQVDREERFGGAAMRIEDAGCAS